jgi:hypothetical protein
MFSASADKVSATVYFGIQPSWDLAFVVSITIDVRPTRSQSSTDGTNGSRATTSYAADASTLGTRTGRAPSASATSDIDTTPSAAMS